MGVIRESVVATISTEAITHIVCDLCGDEANKADIEYDNDYPGWIDNIFAEVKWTAGYGSDFDGDDFEVALCDGCMKLLTTDSHKRDALKAYVKELREGEDKTNEKIDETMG